MRKSICIFIFSYQTKNFSQSNKQFLYLFDGIVSEEVLKMYLWHILGHKKICVQNKLLWKPKKNKIWRKSQVIVLYIDTNIDWLTGKLILVQKAEKWNTTFLVLRDTLSGSVLTSIAMLFVPVLFKYFDVTMQRHRTLHCLKMVTFGEKNTNLRNNFH